MNEHFSNIHQDLNQNKHYSAAQIKKIRKEWRFEALNSLDPRAVYGKWLTGAETTYGSLICRDLESPTGDRKPSAIVSVYGHPDYEPCGIYMFRTKIFYSVFDFMIAHDPEVSNYYEASKKVAKLSGVPLPDALLNESDRSERHYFDSDW